MRHKAVGKQGLVIAILLAAGMTALGLVAFPLGKATGNAGLCLPSPNLWELPQPLSSAAAFTLLLVIAFGLILLNKKNNFIAGQDLVYPASFLVMTAANPWLTHYLGESAILAFGNLLCLALLFSCYGRRDNQNASFYLGSLLGIGAMTQYAFVLYAPVYLLAAVMLKTMRLRDAAAYAIGLFAPFWVTFGSGILPITDFRIPDIELIFFTGFAPPPEVLVMLIATGVTILLGLILLMNNAVSLTRASSKARAFNRVVNLLGVATALFLVVDFANMTAYLCTLFLCVGIQLANAFGYATTRRPAWLAAALAAIYVGIFLVTVYV